MSHRQLGVGRAIVAILALTSHHPGRKQSPEIRSGAQQGRRHLTPQAA